MTLLNIMIIILDGNMTLLDMILIMIIILEAHHIYHQQKFIKELERYRKEDAKEIKTQQELIENLLDNIDI